jgi:MFS family permease
MTHARRLDAPPMRAAWKRHPAHALSQPTQPLQLGDLFITLYLSTRADAFGRRRTLVLGSLLKVLAGAAFASTASFPVLMAAGIVGVISTSGGEIGPFVAVEQACLTDSVLLARGGGGSGSGSGAADVAVLFGWYNALGYLAQAAGALASGLVVHVLQVRGSMESQQLRLTGLT